MQTDYIALLVSFVIAFLLFWMVHWLSFFLDKKLPWDKSPAFRTIIQITFGIVVPAAAAYLMAAEYYRHYGYDIEETGYRKHLFNPIKGYIFLLNIYYNWNAGYEHSDELPGETEPLEETTETSVVPSIEAPDETPDQKPEKDVALIFLKDKFIFVWDANNQSINNWEYDTITASFEALPPGLFLRLGRDVIVRADIIASVKRTGRSLSVTLHDPFGSTYEVGKAKVAAVREYGEQHDVNWWDKKAKKFR